MSLETAPGLELLVSSPCREERAHDTQDMALGVLGGHGTSEYCVEASPAKVKDGFLARDWETTERQYKGLFNTHTLHTNLGNRKAAFLPDSWGTVAAVFPQEKS